MFTLRVNFDIDRLAYLVYGSYMEVSFADDGLEQIYTKASADSGFVPGLATAYRKRIQFILGAKDERDLVAWKSLRFEKLKGKRQHQYSLRLNDQYRLIIEFEGKASDKVVVIMGIEDYH